MLRQTGIRRVSTVETNGSLEDTVERASKTQQGRADCTDNNDDKYNL